MGMEKYYESLYDIKWNVGNGIKIKFWEDWWSGDGRTPSANLKVSDLITDQRTWDTTALDRILLAVLLPIPQLAKSY